MFGNAKKRHIRYKSLEYTGKRVLKYWNLEHRNFVATIFWRWWHWTFWNIGWFRYFWNLFKIFEMFVNKTGIKPEFSLIRGKFQAMNLVITQNRSFGTPSPLLNFLILFSKLEKNVHRIFCHCFKYVKTYIMLLQFKNVLKWFRFRQLGSPEITYQVYIFHKIEKEVLFITFLDVVTLYTFFTYLRKTSINAMYIFYRSWRKCQKIKEGRGGDKSPILRNYHEFQRVRRFF